MRQRLVAFAIIVAACALVLWPPRPQRHDLRITFIDVGQGDAILVQTPRGHTLMIDTGGKLERGKSEDGSSIAEAVGERVVVPSSSGKALPPAAIETGAVFGGSLA